MPQNSDLVLNFGEAHPRNIALLVKRRLSVWMPKPLRRDDYTT